MVTRLLYPVHLCPILKNLSIHHISGYNLIQGAIGCSVASPLGAAKSGIKREHMRNTMSRRNARGALSALPHPSMLCNERYHGKERKKTRKKDKIRVQEEGRRDTEREGEHREIEDMNATKNVCAH